jgi:hypothetical protein
MRPSPLLLLLASACITETPPEKDDEGMDSGSIPFIDQDQDGYPEEVDCDDSKPMVNPGAAELCNGGDDDCDGSVDEGAEDAPFWYFDDDADGKGDSADVIQDCLAPEGTVAESGDCDDRDPLVFPGADELCNEVDDDCDGSTDEDPVDASVWYTDLDEDGWGDEDSAHNACTPRAEDVAIGGDCDDSTDLANPDVPEICGDGLDNDCDGGPGPCDWSDLVSASEAWLRLDGYGAADAAGLTLNAGDFDGDGRRDLAIAAADHGGASFAAGSIYLISAPERGSLGLELADARLQGEGANARAGSEGGIWIGDTDQDGFDDLLVRGRSAAGVGRAYVARGPLSGASYLLSSELVIAEVLGGASQGAGGLSDLDGDGDIELIVSQAEYARFLVFDGAAAGTLGPLDAVGSVPSGADGQAAVLLAGQDLDGDGQQDLIAGHDGGFSMYLGPITGVVDAADAVAIRTYAGFRPRSLQAGDCDGDGVADLLLSLDAGPGGEVRVLSGPIGGTSGPTAATILGDGADQDLTGELRFLGDTDGDGVGDLAVGADGLLPGVLLMSCPVSGAHAAGDAQARFGEGATVVGSPGDVTGDGLDDIFLGIPTGAGEARLYQGGGI